MERNKKNNIYIYIYIITESFFHVEINRTLHFNNINKNFLHRLKNNFKNKQTKKTVSRCHCDHSSHLCGRLFSRL